MNTLEAIMKRKSTRLYKPQQISKEALNTILKAGMAAPVAMAHIFTSYYRGTERAID